MPGRLRALAVPALLLSLLLTPVWADDALDDLFNQIRAVKEQGAGSPAARTAWDKLVRQGPAVLPRILEAMDTPDTVTANWLRTAFDRIAEPDLARGGKSIPVDALLAIVRDTRHQGRVRRFALEVVEQVRPGTGQRLLDGWLDDPAFRYDAVQRLLETTASQKDLPREQRLARYRRAFAATRDLVQARTIAARLRDLKAPVSVANHLGFLRDWYVIGPFDAGGQKGFRTVYPPEKAVDLAAELSGKDGKRLHWKRLHVAEALTGAHVALVNLREPLGDATDAVAYAFTQFAVPEAREVEFRGAADDNLSVWVNGVKVFGFEEYRNGVRLDRHRFRVRLKAGVNAVLVKVCQAPSDPSNQEPNWEFLLRVTDPAGAGLIFPSALPPADSASPQRKQG
jgi:hypothetical protein